MSFRLRVLRSGSGGNAIFIDTGQAGLIVDVGVPAEIAMRELATIPDCPGIAAILLTHEHDDHAGGAGALARQLGVPVFANGGTIGASGAFLDGVAVERFVTGRPFAVGGVEVEAFPVPHDAVEPVGFVIRRNGFAALLATDLGVPGDELMARARDADALVLEANYDLRLLSVSPYPWFLKNRILSPTGHLSNDAAAQVVVAAAAGRMRTVFLVHLSDVNNLTPLARDTVQWALDREGVGGVHIEAVRPNGSSRLWDAARSARVGKLES